MFYWEESLGKLQEIDRRKALEGNQREWFLARKSEMEEAIKVAAEKECPPLPSDVRSNTSDDKQPPSELFAVSIPVLGEMEFSGKIKSINVATNDIVPKHTLLIEML